MSGPFAVAWNGPRVPVLIWRPEDFFGYAFSDVVWLRNPDSGPHERAKFALGRYTGVNEFQAVPIPPPNYMFDETTWVSELSTIPRISPETEAVPVFGQNAYFVEALHLKHTFSASDYPKAREMFRAIAPKAAEASGKVPLADWMAAHVRFLSLDDAAKVLAACVARRLEGGC